MERFGLSDVTHDLLGRIQRTAKTQLESCIARYGGACASEKGSNGKTGRRQRSRSGAAS
ncbi:hypothetical protein SAMN05421783_102237 [Thiocapsa roseopersicina]|uniref:Transposase, Mutator family n=2 Tax=Thiocapsa roseopersicina TaxID=1058 RepID=A0A1H2S1J4_THIRO|nr:hypothetical protein SAMN05421783_102237 [Thiocapsa roseopersicina]